MAGEYITVVHPNGTVETVWTEMDPEPPPPIRRITTQAFFRRMTKAERKTLRTSTKDEVADLREDLQRNNVIDLDGTIEQQLLDTTLLQQARIDELLVNGTDTET